MKNYITLLLIVLSVNALTAQVGIGTEIPNSNAILELKSTNKGLLMSTVALTSTVDATPLTEHLEGILVYNTATNGTKPFNVVPGLYYNTGTFWQPMNVAVTEPLVGDIKQSNINSDHDGWYILNGRAVATLALLPRSNANSLGFNVNLPNATNRFFKGSTELESFGTIGGSEALTITQANLPNITYTGSTSSSGAHSHGFTQRGLTTWQFVAGSSVSNTPGSASYTTGSAGEHTHTLQIGTGGSGTPITFKPKFISTQSFIYLGL
jgi:hypothetical protein